MYVDGLLACFCLDTNNALVEFKIEIWNCKYT